MAASNGVLKVGVPSLVLARESDGSNLLQINVGGLSRTCSLRFSLLLRDADELVYEVCFFCLPFMSPRVSVEFAFKNLFGEVASRKEIKFK